MKELTKLEISHGMDGRIPVSRSVNQRIFAHLFGDWDAVKSESLLVREGRRVDPIFKVKALLFRGRLPEARIELDALRARPGTQCGLQAEAAAEAARLELLRGEFGAAIEQVERSLSLLPPPQTVLSLTQIRALCLFELGDFGGSATALREAEGLGEIFPHLAPTLYLKVLRVKLLARGGRWERSEAIARGLWSSAAPLNPDALLTLLRLDLDLRRERGLSHSFLALGAYDVSRAMGDDVYAALAAVDFHFSLPAVARGRADARDFVLAAIEGRERATRLLACASAEEPPTSTTAAGLRGFRPGPIRLEPGWRDEVSACTFRAKSSWSTSGLSIRARSRGIRASGR